MKVPRSLRTVDHDEATVRTFEYDDGGVIAVDFGTRAGDLEVDVVEGTVIAVTGDRQFEFELPAEASEVTTNNGILTITE